MEEARFPYIDQKEQIDLSEDDKNRLNMIVDVFTRLSIACKSRSLYPADHPTAREAVYVAYSVMDNSLLNNPSIKVRVAKDSMLYESWPIGKKRESLRQLASRIRSLNIQEIVFTAGLTQREVETMVELLVNDPEELEIKGGAKKFLLDKGVYNISVIESTAHRADGEVVEGDGLEAESTRAEGTGKIGRAHV